MPKHGADTVTARSQRFGDILGRVHIAAILGVLVYALTRYRNSENKLLVAVVVAGLIGLLALLFAAMRWLPVRHRSRLVAVMTSTILTIYALEALHPVDPMIPGLAICRLAASGCPRTHRHVDKKPERPYDQRTKAQLLQDLRASGTAAYPHVSPSLLPVIVPTDSSSTGPPLFPLAGVSGVITVLSNENGEYSIYESDEHGFNNPKGLYRRRLDVTVLGDSYTQGAAVPPGEDLVSVIRKVYPQTLNFGMSGGGPLLELAVFREYVEPLQPRRVLWIYDEGSDLIDLRREMANQLLVAYLDPLHRNGLIHRQRAIDDLLRQWIDTEISRESSAEWRQVARKLRDTLLLYRLRGSLGLVFGRNEPPSPGDLLKEILSLANRSTSQWGGKFYFVYLANVRRVLASAGDPALPGDRELFVRRDPLRREEVLRIVRELNITIIDTYPNLLRHHDPRELLPFRGGPPIQHYNAEGYDLIAQTILSSIDRSEPANPAQDRGAAPGSTFPRSRRTVR